LAIAFQVMTPKKVLPPLKKKESRILRATNPIGIKQSIA
jgi:hypothetical protein